MNPFEVFNLDPSLGLSAITEQLRDRMEHANTEDEKAALRSAWEALTLVPRDRFRFALSTPPVSGESLPPPPLSPTNDPFGLDALNPLDFINLSE